MNIPEIAKCPACKCDVAYSEELKTMQCQVCPYDAGGDNETEADAFAVHERICRQPTPEAAELQKGRAHLTVAGEFKSDKYPWCPAGFVPLKLSDNSARDLLIIYANRRGLIDEAFGTDLLEALGATGEEASAFEVAHPPKPEPTEVKDGIASLHEPDVNDYHVNAMTFAGLDPITAVYVGRFAKALAMKLLAAKAKYGYTDGWAESGWEDKCRASLLHHIEKGDPLDVAAFAMFMWKHQWSTAHAPKPPAEWMADLKKLAKDIDDWGDTHLDGPELEVAIKCHAMVLALIKKHYTAPAEGWQPIETGPKGGIKVQLFWDGKVTLGFYLDNSKSEYPWKGWRQLSGEVMLPGKPTLWQPLAAAPKEGK